MRFRHRCDVGMRTARHCKAPVTEVIGLGLVPRGVVLKRSGGRLKQDLQLHRILILRWVQGQRLPSPTPTPASPPHYTLACTTRVLVPCHRCKAPGRQSPKQSRTHARRDAVALAAAAGGDVRFYE